jgi:hypothetical protein
MRKDAALTPGRAVFRGHLLATAPTLLLLLATFALSANWIAEPFYYPTPSLHAYFERLGIVSAFALLFGWLWWSFAILLWRLWMKSRGAEEKATQRLGERTLLLWPKGLSCEKTELRSR